METILNFLRLTQAEREAFQAAAPEAEHLFRPVRHDPGSHLHLFRR